MKELVEFLARSLVDHPDQVQVERREDDEGVVFEVHVAPSDMGQLIGKQGRVAKAVRAVVKAAAVRSSEKRVHVEFV